MKFYIGLCMNNPEILFNLDKSQVLLSIKGKLQKVVYSATIYVKSKYI